MKNLDFTVIGQKIKERRLDLGITQEQIANQLEINPSHVSNIERGRTNPSLTTLIKISNILECSIDYFISSEYSFKKGYDYSILDEEINKRLKICDDNTKAKILKIIDIIY